MSLKYGIHWFRRDLRIAGNPALGWSWKENQGKVLGLFCFDKAFLSRPDFSANRFQFFLDTLEELRRELQNLGSQLLVLDVGPHEAFPALLEKIKDKAIPTCSTFSWNRDYEPFAKARDIKIEKLLVSKGIAVHHERDHLLIEPQELFKDADPAEGYQVFTPFSRKWLSLFDSPRVQARVSAQAKGLLYLDEVAQGKAKPHFSLTWNHLFGEDMPFDDVLAEYRRRNSARVTVPIPKAGSQIALEKARVFKNRVKEYGEKRDLPAEPGTSQLSIYFKNGSLTTAQTIAALGLAGYDKKDKSGPARYLSELIWREFYYHILARHPHVEHEAFQSRFKNLAWENREDWFEAWKLGMTGYPIVDAGMRQLRQTGWMHNRLRMIVASFLTKDLLIDWRWGEQYFMEQLLDGDLAPNNGGWQWAASTGCDPQPYFRVFNPYLQSRKFDAEGHYLRTYLPELKDLDAEAIHQPAPLDLNGYPSPIVDHATQRELALALYSP